MKREKQLNDLRGTIQADAVIEYIELLKEQIKNEVFTSDEPKVAELIGAKVAISHLNKVVRRLEKQEVKKTLNNYD